MQTIRLSSQARDAAEDLADLADRIHRDHAVTPDELATFRARMQRVLDLTAQTDDSLNVAMVWLKGGTETRRAREVMRDYADTHGEPIRLAVHMKTRRSSRGNDPSAA
jgi:hypothetical protein